MKRNHCAASLPAFLAVALLALSCEQPGGTLPPDTDARLGSLALDAGTLVPEFCPDKTSYAAVVRNDTETIAIDASPWSAAARVEITGPDTLGIGGDGNLFKVRVTAESGDAREYKITVTRVDGQTVNIETADDFAKIGREEAFPAAGAYLLCGDITLVDWTPLVVFSGDFEGGGKTITLAGFVSNIGGESFSATGVFGSIRGDSGAARATVKNLTLNYAAPPHGHCRCRHP
jgi:hypothetical protein